MILVRTYVYLYFPFEKVKKTVNCTNQHRVLTMLLKKHKRDQNATHFTPT